MLEKLPPRFSVRLLFFTLPVIMDSLVKVLIKLAKGNVVNGQFG